MDADFLQSRIDACKAQIVAYEAAVLDLASGVQHTSLNTGQTTQVVTYADLGQLQRALDALLNRLATLEARRNADGAVNVRPAW